MIRSISDADVQGRTLLVRADLNVPLADGQVTNRARLQRLAPGLKRLVARGARVVLISHLGRPAGTRVPALSLAPVASALSAVLDLPVQFVPDLRGTAALAAARNLEAGQILVLENLRFEVAEEANEMTFAQDLAALGDLYVNDAFSAAHRAHASTAAVAGLLPAYAGDLMVEELRALDMALAMPDRPLMAIVGGAKVSTKFDLLTNLVTKADFLVIGGGMANTFLHAQGHGVGASLCEPALARDALAVLDRALGLGCEVILPSDVRYAPAPDRGAAAQSGALVDLPVDQMILDFGPKSAAMICQMLPKVKTLIWNGPLGAFEFPPFAAATHGVAQQVAARTRAGALRSIAGGGDTLAALDGAGVLADLSYVSTAGGAFLEWMEGRTLPGVQPLLET